MKNKSHTKPIEKNQITPVSKSIELRWLYLIVFLVSFLLYAGTLNHGYTVDDGTVIENNKYTKQGVKAIGKILTTAYRSGFWDRNEGIYRPVSVVMFAIEYDLSGGKPWLGHLINILLYAITCVLVFKLLLRIFQSYNVLIPLISTLLFAVHPIHTEVVANIKSRDEILSLLFALIAVINLLNYIDKLKTLSLVISISAFAISLFSKESSIAWVGIFPLILWTTTKLSLKEIGKNCAPFLGLAVIYLIVRNQILGNAGSKYELLLINNSLLGTENKLDQLATASFILIKYIGLLLFPKTLIFDYSFNTIPVVKITNIVSLLSTSILLGLIIYAIKSIKNRSIVALGIFVFLGAIALVSNVFFLIEATMAERFVYTPSLGFCILIGAVVAKYIVNEKSSIQTFTLTQLNKNAKIVYPFIVICVLFIGRTVVRAANWKDNITLLQKDVQSAPESARIRYALGSALLIEKAMKEENSVAKSNYLDMAIEHLTKGVALIPNYNDAWYHLGLAYKEKEDYPNAVAALEQANSYKKFTDVNRIISLGTTYGLNRQYSKAIPLLKEALAKDSSSSDAWNNIGLYYGESGNLDSSMLAFANALKINATFEKAFYNRGNIWAKNGNFKQAIQEYAQAIKINPEFEDAYNNTGNCYGALQLPDSAKKYFEKTIALNPNNGKALYNLGITMKILNDSVASESYFTRAKNLNVGQ